MSKDRYEICKGCRTYGGFVDIIDGKKEYSRACLIAIPILSATEQCPCLTCLIKGMCDSGCDEFREYDWLIKRRLCNE